MFGNGAQTFMITTFTVKARTKIQPVLQEVIVEFCVAVLGIAMHRYAAALFVTNTILATSMTIQLVFEL